MPECGSRPLAIALVIIAGSYGGFAAGALLLGLGTAMVYPTLLAAIGDVAHPSWRASAVGVYRFWRDLGYAIGALVAGAAADQFGLAGAMWLVAGLTLLSGIGVAIRMRPPSTQSSLAHGSPARRRTVIYDRAKTSVTEA